jgi:plastocyanin
MRCTYFACVLSLGLLFCQNGVPQPATAQYSNNQQAGNTVTVVIEDDAFVPPIIFVQPGDTVLWINAGKHNHTVMAGNQSWGSEEIAKGGSYSYKFSSSGTYDYVCQKHQKMKGSVIVMP